MIYSVFANYNVSLQQLSVCVLINHQHEHDSHIHKIFNGNLRIEVIEDSIMLLHDLFHIDITFDLNHGVQLFPASVRQLKIWKSDPGSIQVSFCMNARLKSLPLKQRHYTSISATNTLNSKPVQLPANIELLNDWIFCHNHDNHNHDIQNTIDNKSTSEGHASEKHEHHLINASLECTKECKDVAINDTNMRACETQHGYEQQQQQQHQHQHGHEQRHQHAKRLQFVSCDDIKVDSINSESVVCDIHDGHRDSEAVTVCTCNLSTSTPIATKTCKTSSTLTSIDQVEYLLRLRQKEKDDEEGSLMPAKYLFESKDGKLSLFMQVINPAWVIAIAKKVDCYVDKEKDDEKRKENEHEADEHEVYEHEVDELHSEDEQRQLQTNRSSKGGKTSQDKIMKNKGNKRSELKLSFENVSSVFYKLFKIDRHHHGLNDDKVTHTQLKSSQDDKELSSYRHSFQVEWIPLELHVMNSLLESLIVSTRTLLPMETRFEFETFSGGEDKRNRDDTTCDSNVPYSSSSASSCSPFTHGYLDL